MWFDYLIVYGIAPVVLGGHSLFPSERDCRLREKELRHNKAKAKRKIMNIKMAGMYETAVLVIPRLMD